MTYYEAYQNPTQKSEWTICSEETEDQKYCVTCDPKNLEAVDKELNNAFDIGENDFIKLNPFKEYRQVIEYEDYVKPGEIHAYEAAPEHTVSPLMYSDGYEAFPDLIIPERKRWPEKYEAQWEMAFDEWECIVDDFCWQMKEKLCEKIDGIEICDGESLKEYWDYQFGHGYLITSEMAEKLYKALNDHVLNQEYRRKDEVKLEVFSILTGRNWKKVVIRGCCQSDYEEIYIPTDTWSKHMVDTFEVEYFNLGSEWRIEDGDDEYYGYTHGWNNDLIAEEIAHNMVGNHVKEVVLHFYNGDIVVKKF